jgi:hypothetical protein
MSGHPVARTWVGSAAYVLALREAEQAMEREPEIIVLAVDSLLSPDEITRWYEGRYTTFVRNPLPPSEGAAAMRLTRAKSGAMSGSVRSIATARSEATDENDLPTDGVALTRVFASLGLPARVPLVVGPRDVDPLRARDFHLASARHRAAVDEAEMPSFEGRIGLFGSAAGLMSAVFALAWLRHELPLPEEAASRVALAWARSGDGTVSATLLAAEAA